MTKKHHPRTRADRLRLAAQERFDRSHDRAGHVEKRLREEAIAQKEALDALRKQVLEEV